MDIKYCENHLVLHLIDHATRFSSAAIIRSKHKDTIISKVFQIWIFIFGPPKQILTDNGGEFTSDDFREMGEKFNTTIKTIAAESPWSNRINERHNAIIGNMAEKIHNETKCSMDIAIASAVSSKNALANVHGYSPNQLVFGSIYVRIHPCRIREKNYEFSKSESDKSSRLCQTDDFSTQTFSAYDKENSYTPLVFESDDETGPEEQEIPHNIQVLGSNSQQGLQESQDVSLDVHLPNTQEDAQESLNESTGEIGSSSEPQGEPIVKFSAIVLPRMKSTVQYLSNKNDEWKTVDIISWGGKATRKYRNSLNIKDKDQVKCIDWKEEVKEWVPVNTEQVLMTGTKLQDLSVAEAKLKELQKWKNYEVYEEIPNEGQRIISCCWVCTQKPTVNGTVIKARLVASGFEEESCVLRKDSPICSDESLRLIFTITSSNHWEVNSLDIQSAFLQGKSVTRDVYLMPPKEAGTEKLWKLKKCVYGLTDASRHWYLRVAEELSKLGVHKSIYDEAVFYWYFGNVLHGIICTHVDDFFWGGSARFKSSQISQESHYNFSYVGLQVNQHQDGIKMHQCAYTSEMEVMEIDKERLYESLNADEKQKYRTLIGQLNWVSSQTRPDIAFEACKASVSFKDAKVSDLTKLIK